jgi:hypothetical protein
VPYSTRMDRNEDSAAGAEFALPFIPGLLLNERFYREAVQPILAEGFPRLRYSAALIGPGSDVLGYDTARSTDHEWGPRLLLFVSAADHAQYAAAIHSALADRLPPAFMGYSTHFGAPGSDGARTIASHAGGPIAHKIDVHSPRLLATWLGFDPLGELSAVDWLIVPQQRLLDVTAGRVYHDGLDLLGPVREKLAYYPRDIWLSLLAAQWRRISQQEAFVGRAGEAGDDLGSAVVAAALVRDLMGLGFLLERRYAPYSKWFGTAFAALKCAPRLTPLFRRTLRAETWREREDALAAAYEIVAELHNALGITAPLDPRTRAYYSRPFRVIFAERFCAAIVAEIRDAAVRAIVDYTGLIGSVDQVSDNVDVLANPQRVARLRALYEAAAADAQARFGSPAAIDESPPSWRVTSPCRT